MLSKCNCFLWFCFLSEINDCNSNPCQHIPVPACKVIKDSTVKMTLMSAFYRHVLIMARVAMFLAIIPASVPQDMLESCAIQILMNAWNTRVRTDGPAGME